jgi:hypothetical protein
MSRFYKIAAFFIAVISFSKEDAFAVWLRDCEGFRPVCARKAFRPHHAWHARKAVSVSMRPGVILGGPGSLYARRVCVPILMRLNGAPAPFYRPAVRFLAPAPFFSRRVWRAPMVLRPTPTFMQAGRVLLRTR